MQIYAGEHADVRKASRVLSRSEDLADFCEDAFLFPEGEASQYQLL